MRIHLITSNFPPEVGGIETHVYQLAKNLAKDHDVEVLWITESNNTPQHEELSVQKIPPYTYTKRTIPNVMLRGKKILENINTFDPDIIHSHNIGHNISISLINPDVPVVFTNHSSQFLSEFYRGRYRDMLKFKLSFGYADYCITPSEELRKATRKITETPVIEIPNGVNIERFHPKAEEAKIPEYSTEDFIVLTTRRFERKNGMRYLAEAIPRTNKQIKYVLLGDGAEREKVQQSIESNNAMYRVSMPGTVPNEQIHKYYSRADVCIMPSLKEAVSISALESMATGTPLIGTKVGGLPEIISDGENGLLVPPKDPEAISKAINELYSSPNILDRMSRNARDTVRKRYSWETITKNTIEIYENVLQ
ncbi:hypothetical protein DJ73_19385 [Halorubrum sp. Ea1]|uniref:glycosyltransferase family 4 protein n=1 Tax=Halorubrum sp. Ea1 TaxID=1480718 RepID=UPI000B97DF5B|nr:glycosyltransferase family 4 protein [Halorubrum sp. Ea1]OYR48485.1 hypothetical protein DJ73_19385 [Halorubrum sp. Ea1]